MFPVVGFSGKLQSGKSTAAKILVGRGYIRTRFAQTLKRMLIEAGLTYKQVDGSIEDKNQKIYGLGGYNLQYTAMKMLYVIGVKPTDFIDKPSEVLYGWTPKAAIELMFSIDLFGVKDGITPRKAMQLIGTEWGREIHKDFWVLDWTKNAKKLINEGKSIVCDDVRFQNEFEAVHDLGGATIRIHTMHEDASLNEDENHVSEQSDFGDYHILNYMDGVDKFAETIYETLNELVH